MNRPSGFSARRIWIRAPTTSLVQCRPSVETIRSRLAGGEGQALLVEHHARARAGRPAWPATGRPRSAVPPGAGAAVGQRLAEGAAARREVDGQREVAHDRLQALGDVLGGAPVQEVGATHSPARRGPGACGAGCGRRGGGGGHERGRWRLRRPIGNPDRGRWRCGAARSTCSSRRRRWTAGRGRWPAGSRPSAWSRIHFLDGPVCDGCGAPFEYDLGRALRGLPGQAPGLRRGPRRLPLRRDLARSDPEAEARRPAGPRAAVRPLAVAARPAS